MTEHDQNQFTTTRQGDHAPDRMGPLTPVLTAYLDARGEREDQVWAEHAVVTMVREEVSPTVARRVLEEALPLVRESGQGPEELYGPARTWAREEIASRAQDGEVVVDSTPDSTWRDVPVIGSVSAVAITLMMMVVWWVRDGLTVDYTWELVLLPLLGSVAVIAALTVHERLLTRGPRWIAIVAALAVMAAGVALLAWLVLGTADEPFARGSVFWLAAVAAGYAVLAGALDRGLPEARVKPLSDTDWERELAGTLRLRMGMTEARVQEIVREARDHAGRSGTSLVDEFGSPASYASRFPKDRPASARRTAWLTTSLIPVTAIVAFGGMPDELGWDGLSWGGVALLVLSVVLTVQAWRRVRESQ